MVKNFPGKSETFRTIVVGGGQAGLAIGHELSALGEDFVILDHNLRTGDAWRSRWDSLRLFTPSQFNRLPGMPFPSSDDYFPAKEEVAAYLESYAMQFNLPVRHGVKVETLSREEGTYRLDAGASHFSAANVIVASGPYSSPRIPALAGELDPTILQLHSSAYRNPQQLPIESVLVVGAGNSGAEIALELADAGKRVWLAGRDVGVVPTNRPLGKVFGGRPMWWFMNHVLTVDTPIGRKLQANVEHRGTPLGRTNRRKIAAAEVMLTPRLACIQSGKPQTEDGHILPAQGVVWATGFCPDYGWIKLPIFDEHGLPGHRRGIVRGAPGLYFLGLPFQTGLTSSLLGGVGTDAAFIAEQIAHSELPS